MVGRDEKVHTHALEAHHMASVLLADETQRGLVLESPGSGASGEPLVPRHIGPPLPTVVRQNLGPVVVASVPLAEKEADQPAVGVVHLLLAPGEADPCGVDDGEVARHRFVQSDEAVVEHLDRAGVWRGAGRDIHTKSTLTAASVVAD
jgi:hypothetical protein